MGESRRKKLAGYIPELKPTQEKTQPRKSNVDYSSRMRALALILMHYPDIQQSIDEANKQHS